MQSQSPLTGAPIKGRAHRAIKTTSLISAVTAAALFWPNNTRAAAVYFVGVNSSGAADTNFDDAAADTNFNTTDTTPGTINYADGDAVIFTDLNGGNLLGVTVNTTTTAGSTGPTPASIVFEANGGSAATAGYNFTNGTATTGISGSGSLTLATGYEGEVELSSVNSYTGGTFIDGGILHAGTGSFPASTTFTLGGGTFQSTSGSSSSAYGAGQNFVATAGTSSSLQSGGSNPSVSGTVSSTAGATATNTILNFIAPTSGSALTYSISNLNGFTGTIETGSLGSNYLRLNYAATNAPDAGSATAIFDMGAGTGTLETDNGGGSGSSSYINAIPLGALEGSGTGSKVEGATHSDSTFYAIGGLGLSTTYNGTVTNNTEPLGIIVVGGALTLTNGNNAYTLGTNILGGALYANNTTGATATGTAGVLVANNVYNSVNTVGTLGGTGTVSGAVGVNLTAASTTFTSSSVPTSFAAGGHIAPGSAGSSAGSTVGTLTLSGGLTLNDYSNLDFTLGSSPTTGDDMISMGSAGVLTLPFDDTRGQDVMVNFTFTGAPMLNTPYTLISYTAADVNGSDVADWNATVPNGDSVVFADTGSAITATFTSVPEPASLGLLAVGVGSLLVRRRRGSVSRLM